MHGESHLQRRLSALYWTVIAPSIGDIWREDSSPLAHGAKPEISVLEPDVCAQLPCNFTLVSDSGEEFKCHDWVIYARWPFIQRMLDSGAEETLSKRAQLPGFQSATLRAFLRFLYTNDVSEFVGPNTSLAINLLTQAQMYHIADLCTPPNATIPSFKYLLAHCKRVLSSGSLTEEEKAQLTDFTAK